MNCKNCGVSVIEKPLNRVNEFGVDGIFWCEDCIKENKPELFKKIKDEESPIEKDLKEIFYGNNKI